MFAAVKKHVKEGLKRTIVYYVKKFLGEYTNVSYDQVKVSAASWSTWKITFENVDLTPKAVNTHLEDFPFEITDGFIGQACASVPLGDTGFTINISHVDITLRPKAPTSSASQLLEAMSESMVHSMDASMRFAAEAIREEDPKHARASSTFAETKEVQELAQVIDTVLNKLFVTIEDITIRLEDVKDGKVTGMDIHIDRLEYFDDRAMAEKKESSVDFDQESRQPFAWLTKNIQAYGIKIDLDDDASAFVPPTFPDSTGTSPTELYVSALDEVQDGDTGPQRSQEEEDEAQYRATPITVAMLAGKLEAKLKMKANENVEGPKMGIEANLGALYSLLSPKQLKFLMQILTSFVLPSESSPKSSQAGALNRPMGPEDYKKVDETLQCYMKAGHFEDVTEPLAADCAFLADGGPMFFPMDSSPPGGPNAMTMSTTSLDSSESGSTRATSVFPAPASSPVAEKQQKQQEKVAQKVRDSAARVANDPSTDRTCYQVVLGALSVCILHEEPHDGSRKHWFTKMDALSKAFFQGTHSISAAGQAVSLVQLRDKLSAILPRDHLGLLCKPVVLNLTDRNNRNVQSYSVDLSVHCAELVECLSDSRNRSNSFPDHEPAGVPQYCEILTFPNTRKSSANDDAASAAPLPAIRLNTTINSKTGPFGYTYKETKVSLELGSLSSELDITIQDRVNTLLNTLAQPKPAASQFGQSLLTPDGRFGFDEAMQDAAQNNNATTFSVSCPHASVRVRIPIPDLRPSPQLAPSEWWGRRLHKESLLLEIDHLTISRQDKPEAGPSAPSLTALMCSKVEAYMQEDIDKCPVLFGTIAQGSGDVGDIFDRPRVVVKAFPPTSTPLEALEEEERLYTESLNGGLSVENNLLFVAPGSSPFALSRDVTQGTEGLEGEDQEGFDSTFEKISPGSKEEIRKFTDVSASNTSLLVEITAPKLLVHTQDKAFLELLYNRINNDLLLWEPQSPSSPEVIASGVMLNVQPYIKLMGQMTQSYHEHFQSQFDSDSDLEDEASPHASQECVQQPARYHLPSIMCLSITVGDGKLFATVPIKDAKGAAVEGCHGELLLIVKDASLFASIGHEGNKDLRYLTLNANRAQLLHAGQVDNSKAPIRMEHLDALTPDNNSRFQHMQDRVYRSEHSVPVEPLTDVGTGDASEDMVSVAVEIKIDTLNNSKHFCIAAAVRGGTLRHKKFPSGESWIDQVLELLNLTDYPIEGYTMPEVLTDLHFELTGCAVDYRTPLSSDGMYMEKTERPVNFHMPMRALLTVQKFSLAVNLNTKTNYTPLKFLLEEAKLWLSDKDFMEIRLKKDYVCLAHMALLEIGLRLGQAREGGSKTLLWLSNSKTELRMCADSCAALTSLIDHFMHDVDLQTPEQLEADQQLADEMERSIAECLEGEKRDLQHQHVEKLVADALIETAKPTATPAENCEQGSRQLFFVPDSDRMEQQQPLPAAGLLDMTAIPPAEDIDWDDDEESFTILDEPGLGVAPKNGEPVVRWFVDPNKPLQFNKDFLAKAGSNTSANELKTPDDWPTPEFKCVLRELNLHICCYGGNDFEPKEVKKEEARPQKEEKVWPESGGARPKAPVPEMWKGGLNRRHDFMAKFTLHKLRLNYETYAEKEQKSRRMVLLVKRMEIEDHLEVSKYNKFLYWPGYETSHEGANMVCLKMMWNRPDDRFMTEECSIMATLQPIKVHINQDTLQFMQVFFANVSEYNQDNTSASNRTPSPSHSSSGGTPRREKSSSRERAPILSVEGIDKEEERQGAGDDNLIDFDESASEKRGAKPKPKPEIPKRIDIEPEGEVTFFKSFVLTRDVIITIDYCGTCAGINRSDDFSTIARGVVTGMLSLEKVEIRLKRLECKRGYKGVDRLVQALVDEWYYDIKANQIGAVVGGIGPLSAFTQLITGIQDFFTMPIVQYRRDGRVWRGLQKGALSLKTSAQLAVLDLLLKLLDSVQVCSEYCFDFLSAGKSVRSYRSRHGPRPPKDIREGVSGAYRVLTEGVSQTVKDLVNVAAQQQEQKGFTGAVGAAVRTTPVALPFAFACCTSAGHYLLTGVRNEKIPGAKKEDEEKWKSK